MSCNNRKKCPKCGKLMECQETFDGPDYNCPNCDNKD